VNGEEVNSTPVVIWTENGDNIELCRFTACMDLHLESGWNLISWNRQLTMDIDEFLGLFYDCGVNLVLGFDQGALTYDPDLPEFSTLQWVDYYHGYWVHVDDACDIQLCAPALPLFGYIDIDPGWNLIGYWPDEPLPVDSALNTIRHATEVVLGFDNGCFVYLPNDPVHTTLITMSPGFGYWVKSSMWWYLTYPGWPTVDCTWVASPRVTTPDVVPSSNWMSIYGRALTLDGEALADGAVIEAYTADGVRCGRGRYSDGLLKFVPVYGNDGRGEIDYPNDGESITLRVDGVPVYPTIPFRGSGNRVQLSMLTSGSNGLPITYGLMQNYPNPFNPTTEIGFSLPEPSVVKLAVYNVMGQKVATLADGFFEAGEHILQFSGVDDAGRSLASGLYLYRLEAGHFTASRKMLLLK